MKKFGLVLVIIGLIGISMINSSISVLEVDDIDTSSKSHLSSYFLAEDPFEEGDTPCDPTERDCDTGGKNGLNG